MAHANAKVNEYGRMLLVSRLEEGWTQAEVAEAQGVSRGTVAKWAKRYREEGAEGLRDRSSRARRLPHALEETVIEAICALRRELGADMLWMPLNMMPIGEGAVAMEERLARLHAAKTTEERR